MKPSTTRRSFLRTLAGSAGALTLSGLNLPKSVAASAGPAGGTRRLVLINLQGAYDALALLPPRPGTGLLRSDYEALRPVLALHHVPLALSGVPGFGLHPALQPLVSHWNAGDLAIVQKVGLPEPELSHFKAQEVMSLGRANRSHPDKRGWLGRTADMFFTGSLDIVGVGVPNRVDFVANSNRPTVLTRLDDLTTYPLTNVGERVLRENALRQMLAQQPASSDRLDTLGRSAARQGFQLQDVVGAATANINTIGNYPAVADEILGSSLRDIIRMMRAGIGTRIYYTRSAQFDHHGGEEASNGNVSTLTARMSLVMNALSAFIADLKASPSVWNDTAIVIFTEFGRRNFENAARGTDHGRGFHAFVLGGSVQGGLKGQVVSRADIDVTAGNDNLPVQIDYRSLFIQSLGWLGGGIDPFAIFDDYSPLPGQPSYTLF
jgi:uncharacterized protein (DUF1501 family)